MNYCKFYILNVTKVAFFVLIALSIFDVTHVLAASPYPYPYNPSSLITDEVFTNTSTMNASEIQAFLINENSGLKNMSFVVSCNPTTPISPYGFSYYPNCGTTQTAATIIYEAAQAYGINPQVILSTMQKEQSLVNTPDPTSSQLNCAMGYTSCVYDQSFFSQVDNGTWQLRENIELMEGNSWWGYSPSNYLCAQGNSSFYSTGLMPGNTVTFFDSGGTPETITLANAATAALYCYTPYVGPISVTGYNGSYNFVESFEEWFGSTQGVNIIPAEDAVYRLYNPHTGDHFITASASEADTYSEAGWYYDGIIAHSDVNGTVPVYRLWNATLQQHYYTTSSTVVSNYESQGWSSDGIIFYGDSSGAPVWEMSMGDKSFVTSSPQEFYTYLHAGWTSDGILYYEPSNYVYPVYRLFNFQTGDHFLTASVQE